MRQFVMRRPEGAALSLEVNRAGQRLVRPEPILNLTGPWRPTEMLT
jgi:hypothetical protein